MKGMYILGIIAGLLAICVCIIEVLNEIHCNKKWATIKHFAYAVSSGFWAASAIVFALASIA